MKHLVVFLIAVVVGHVYGTTQQFPINEESNYHSTCENANVAVNLSNLGLTAVTEHYLSNPLVTCLDLSNNYITHVEHNAFIDLPNLRYLNMSKNRFDLNDIFSQSLLNLETLILDYNRFIPRDKYFVTLNAPYPKLKRLFMRYNIAYTCINSILLENPFPSLTHLYLSGTTVHSACTDVLFTMLPDTLEYLDLTASRGYNIRLHSLDNLQYLILNDMNLQVTQEIHLVGLSNLKYLSATSNYLGELPSTFLSTVPSLIFLDLSDNTIQIIEKSFLQNLTNLEFLSLSYNCINRIEEEAFDRLASLKILNLEKNNIRQIPALSNEKLANLSLRYNELERVDAGAFKKLPHLQILNLSNNRISAVDQDAFVGLGNLKYLTLANNLLTSLPPNWMISLTRLELLELRNNPFQDFEKLSLSDSSTLKDLYLKNSISIKRSKSLVIPENVTVWILDESFDERTETENIKKCQYS